MKVVMLAAANSIHTVRWADALIERGIDVLLVTQNESLPGAWRERVPVHRLRHDGMVGYVRNVPEIARIVRAFAPDLIHAHYAGGYGLSALLLRRRPKIVSVWGADVFDVPQVSPFHRLLTIRILEAADMITSTSEVMARQVRALGVKRAMEVVPFGIDTNRFYPAEIAPDRSPIVIGTIKTMAPKYGIDTLIEAFAILQADPEIARLPRAHRLRLVGGGPQLGELQALVRARGLDDMAEFVGHVEYDNVPRELRGLDIYAAPSRLDSESFGVAVIEASAAAVPVVVSDAGGLPEVVDDGVTGYVVPRDRPDRLAVMLKRLVLDTEERHRLGAAGRVRAIARYEWQACVDRMLAIYERLIAGRIASSGR